MILIVGATASGKSRLAHDLAKSIDGEIISIDSMKVYRRMDIGTAKPSLQWQREVKYHLIDIIEPSESFNAAAYLEQAESAISDIKSRSKEVIAVGGTALYIKALLYGLFDEPGSDQRVRAELTEKAEAEGTDGLYQQLKEIDPVAAERINQNDARRIVRALEVFTVTGKPISSFQQQWESHSGNNTADNKTHNWTIIGLRREKADASSRINARVKKMVELGLVDEVRSLLREEKPLSDQARCAIGYAEIIQHLNGDIDIDKAVEMIKKNTRRFAKSQRTWFKTFKNINWLDIDSVETAENILERTKEIIAADSDNKIDY